MELLGATSAGVGLIVPAAGLAKLAGTLFADLRDAPIHLAALKSSIRCCETALKNIAALQDDTTVPEEAKEVLTEFINFVQASFEALQHKGAKLPRTRGAQASVKWALLDRHAIRDINLQLNQALGLLQTVIAIRTLYVCRPPYVQPLTMRTKRTTMYVSILHRSRRAAKN